MNILQVSCEGLGRGGVQRVIMDITKNMYIDNNIDIVLFTNEKRYYEDEFISYGGEIYRIPKIRRKNNILNKINYYVRGPRIFFKMIRILHKKKYDVIHCHNEYESGICVLAAFFVGVKIRITHLHRADYNNGIRNIFNIIYNKFLYLLIYYFSTRIICCSEKTKKTFFKKNIRDLKNKITIMNNCIELKRFTQSKNIKEDGFILTHIGQFCDNKNQLFIIDLMEELTKRFDNIQLNLVGFGDGYKEKIMKKISSLNLNRYVKIFPEDANIPQILSKTDLFIFPSITEGLGLVLLEAQAMNVPCIASDTVTKETDLGLVQYESLNANKMEWVKDIIEIYKGNCCLNLDKEKLKRVDISYYIKKLEKIYKDTW